MTPGTTPWALRAVNAGMLILAFIWAIPIVWAIIVSFRPPSDTLNVGDVWMSSEGITTESYETATDLAPFFPKIEDGEITDSYYANTLQYVLLTLGVQIFTITMAAFAFVNYDFPGKRILFYVILLQMMIPAVILLVPNFQTIREFSTETLLIPRWLFYKEMNLYDTPWAISMPYWGSAFGTFLMRQAFLEVPQDLVDAGKMDGCRWYHLLWHIYLPPSRSTMVAFALVSVSFHWSSLLWPLVVTSDNARPLTMGLLRFTQLTDIGAQWSLIMAATVIIIAPLMLAFLFFQRQFIRSFMHSGLK